MPVLNLGPSSRLEGARGSPAGSPSDTRPDVALCGVGGTVRVQWAVGFEESQEPQEQR